MAVMPWRDYLFPSSIQEALDLLAFHQGRARLIAGGTDLVLQSQRGQCLSEVMVDITRIPNLDFIEEREGWVYLGALVTHAQVAASPLIRQRAPVLAAACYSVGSPQIRNVGTLVGNVVNAMPAADGAIALFALDAEVEVTTLEGNRWLPIASLYRDIGVCAVNACAEMVTALRFHPLPAGYGSAFERLARRRALTLPILNVAVVIGQKGGRISEARIAIGPVAPTPFRAAEAEAFLVGQLPDAAVFAQAARRAAEAARPRDSLLRGSREYRIAMVEVLVRRALTRAIENGTANQ